MDLESELASGLDDILNQFSPKFCGNRVKIRWCRRRGVTICDLVANLTLASHGTAGGHSAAVTPDCLQELICDVVTKSKKWSVPIEKCEAMSMPVLQINMWLSRAAMATVVLNSVIKECEDFAGRGTTPHLPKLRALICAPAIDISTKSCGLSELRTLILMELTKRILETKSFQARTTHRLCANGICQLTCSAEKLSPTPEKLMKQVQLTGVGNDAQDIDPTRHVDCLQHIIHSSVQKPIDLRVMVTHRHVDVHSAAGREFWNHITECEDIVLAPIIRLVHGPVVWRNDHPNCTTAEELYRMQHDVVKNSFTHKYGATTIGEGDLGAMFEELADLTIKFNILACSMSKPVQLKIDESGSGGTFVMYNYARICVLLSNFMGSTRDKVLPSLPPIEEVDFSLLKKEEEWNLVLLLARYPKLIHDIARALQDNKCDCSVSPAFHSIIEYMSELGHRISVYYSHVRVLMPAVHLKDVMFARLWLLKCVKRILEDIFRLLNVIPVKQIDSGRTEDFFAYCPVVHDSRTLHVPEAMATADGK